MKEVRFFYVPDAAGSDTLPDEEAQHALRVLRLKAGDALFLMDGQGTFYEAEVTLATGKKCLYALREALPQEKTWQGNIHLAIAPTKMMERMEWLAEKATEVGFDRLTFLDCRFSERRNIRTDRVDKIVVSATKQSRKAWKPAVEPLTPFKAFVEQDRPGENTLPTAMKRWHATTSLNCCSRRLPRNGDGTGGARGRLLDR
jgi:16S rRNA (uracil1498-N3)-methyltransferase